MLQSAKSSVKAALRGIGSFQIEAHRDYGAYVPQSAGQVFRENWRALGERLRESADKVISENGKQLQS